MILKYRLSQQKDPNYIYTKLKPDKQVIVDRIRLNREENKYKAKSTTKFGEERILNSKIINSQHPFALKRKEGKGNIFKDKLFNLHDAPKNLLIVPHKAEYRLQQPDDTSQKVKKLTRSQFNYTPIKVREVDLKKVDKKSNKKVQAILPLQQVPSIKAEYQENQQKANIKQSLWTSDFKKWTNQSYMTKDTQRSPNSNEKLSQPQKRTIYKETESFKAKIQDISKRLPQVDQNCDLVDAKFCESEKNHLSKIYTQKKQNLFKDYRSQKRAQSSKSPNLVRHAYMNIQPVKISADGTPRKQRLRTARSFGQITVKSGNMPRDQLLEYTSAPSLNFQGANYQLSESTGLQTAKTVKANRDPLISEYKTFQDTDILAMGEDPDSRIIVVSNFGRSASHDRKAAIDKIKRQISRTASHEYLLKVDREMNQQERAKVLQTPVLRADSASKRLYSRLSQKSLQKSNDICWDKVLATKEKIQNYRDVLSPYKTSRLEHN